MRTINAIKLLAGILLSLAVLTGHSFALENADFERYAEKVSSSIDNDWQRIVSRTVPASQSAGSRPHSGLAASSASAFSSRMSGGLNRGWQGVNSAGFLRSGNSQFLAITSRDRSSPVRGNGKLLHPARTRLGGKRRLPFNSVSKYRNSLGTGRRGAERRHPDFGTRITSSSRRSSGTSRGTLGTSRTRRRR